METYKKLKEARKAMKMTQNELSQLLSLPQGYISQVESGKHDIKLSTLTDWTRVLGLELIILPSKEAREVLYLLHTRSANSGKQLPPAYKPLPEGLSND